MAKILLWMVVPTLLALLVYIVIRSMNRAKPQKGSQESLQLADDVEAEMAARYKKIEEREEALRRKEAALREEALLLEEKRKLDDIV